MSAHSSPGTIHIGVETDAAGRVSSVTLLSTRPTGLGRVFIGRPPQEAPKLARQLFSLCGFAHAAAARLALASARGEALTPSETFSIAVGLLAETCAESLRSTALGWPREGRPEALAEAATPLREAMAAARLIMSTAAADGAFPERRTLSSAAKTLIDAARALGLDAAGTGAPAADSLLGAIMAEARGDAFLFSAEPDALQPADDVSVALAIERNGERFAAAPTLPHRIVETGPFARFWPEAVIERSHLAARLRARLHATSQALNMLWRALSYGEAAADDLMSATRRVEGEGFAAVETARGRLYHWARLDAGGEITDYVLAAPTEWNFHPAGPFAAALLGAEIGKGENARLRIRRLAAAFDPCVAFQIELREQAHA